MAVKKVKILIKVAVWIDGVMRTKGTEIVVEEALAKNLFERKKAVLATASEPKDGDKTDKAKKETGASKAAAKK